MKSKGLLLGALVALIVAAVVALLVIAPWKSDDQPEQTFALADDISVTAQLPAGWKGATSQAANTALVIVPEGETRVTYADLDAAVTEMSKNPNVAPVHATFVTAADCGQLNLPPEALPVGNWQTGEVTSDVDSGVANTTMRAMNRLNEHECLLLVAMDSQAGTKVENQSAVDLAKALINDKKIRGSATK